MPASTRSRIETSAPAPTGPGSSRPAKTDLRANLEPELRAGVPTVHRQAEPAERVLEQHRHPGRDVAKGLPEWQGPVLPIDVDFDIALSCQARGLPIGSTHVEVTVAEGRNRRHRCPDLASGDDRLLPRQPLQIASIQP